MPLPGDIVQESLILEVYCRHCHTISIRSYKLGSLYPAVAYCSECDKSIFIRNWVSAYTLNTRQGKYTIEELIGGTCES